MKKPTEEMQGTANRRKFLLGATLGTAGAVAVAVTSGVRDAAEAALPDEAGAKQKQKGYHMSAHIQQYYDTTRNM
jgi:nitrous oxide reductase